MSQSTTQKVRVSSRYGHTNEETQKIREGDIRRTSKNIVSK